MASGENRAFWQKVAPGYDDLVDDDYMTLVRRTVKDVGPADRVLDVATGTGLVALELSRQVGNVEAIDFVEEMIAAACLKAEEQGASNVNFSTSSAYDLNFQDHSFDAVIILNALHVMKTPKQALLESNRVLKPGGRLVCPTFCRGKTTDVKKVQKISEFQ